MVPLRTNNGEKNDTLGCEKKIQKNSKKKKKIKNPKFWSRCEPISVKKNDTLGCEKKIKKKKKKKFFQKSWILVRANQFWWKKQTPSVVTVGLGWPAASRESHKFLTFWMMMSYSYFHLVNIKISIMKSQLAIRYSISM